VRVGIGIAVGTDMRATIAATTVLPVDHEAPTRLSAAWFLVRVRMLQVKRGIEDAFARIERCAQVELDDASFSVVAGESRTRLWTDYRPAEASYQRGKIQNLERAARELDGAFLPAGRTFSFWKQIGRATEDRGYVTGRMLQQGCMIPAVGGGLCQLSNGLYDAAEQAKCEIVERHAHSRIVPGSAAAIGRDATVAWNYVDLRFRAPHDVLIRASMTDRDLVVTFLARPGALLASRERIREQQGKPQFAVIKGGVVASSCGTCGKTHCFRNGE
jgi:vancomycin resistance protein YoaR